MIVPSTTSSTLLDLLRGRADRQPDRRAYSFWSEEGDERHLTYSELDLRARALAAQLQERAQVGERALLLYPPGFEYLVAFWGCLYAGVLAVPAYPPRANGNLERLLAVVRDCEATLALTTASVHGGIERRFRDAEGLAQLDWVVTEETREDELSAQAAAWRPPVLSADTLAFLQYTSGSTGTPKGVMLSHGNLLHNLGLIEESFGTSSESRGVVWLPPYHDMGLIGGILQPLFTGYPMTLMAPVDFITRPLRWLQAITRTGATVSGGPNFAYDLCVQKITPEQRDSLDLSSWDTAFTGAEPIRAETLDRFAEYFAPCGFRREAFYPCYGLAETTLFAAGGVKGEAPVVGMFDSHALEEGRVLADGGRSLVSSGRLNSQRLLLADPATGALTPPGRVGEIWISGPSVAQGYWQRPEQTEDTFRACLAETGEGPFLRTGDLGFLQDGELYITGRLKDLIIIRGRNHYPQDIEHTVQQSHAALRADAGAAFSVDADGEERLVIVQEVERTFRKANHAEIAAAIREAVAQHHELQAFAVLLLKPASIPKTSSGKIQRHACRDRFGNGGLDELYRDILGGGAADETAESDAPAPELLTREDLLALEPTSRRPLLEKDLRARAAQILKTAPAKLLLEQPLQFYGLDSLMAVELKNDLEDRFLVEVPLAALLDGLTLHDLTEQVLASVEQYDPSSDIGTAVPNSVPALVPSDAPFTDGPLSYGQRSLWFLQRVAPDSAAYNIARAVRLTGDLNREALRQTFDTLARRHAALRTTFPFVNGEPVQRVAAQGSFLFEAVDASAWPETELQSRLTAESHQPFDLEKGPLARIRVYQRASQEHILLLTLHHIIADFWSLGVLVQELQTLYPALRSGKELHLPPPAVTYADYARDQAVRLSGGRGEKLWNYWQQQLSGTLPQLQLPTDRPRPPVQTYRGASLSFRLPGKLTAGIKRLAQERGATLYTLLLAAYQVLLHRYTGQDDILVGSPTVGRSSAQHANVFGYFVNPVVLRGSFGDGETFESFLARVKGTVLEALDHQDYPFALLVERLQPRRDLSYPPLIQTMFVLQRSHALDAEGLTAFALGDARARLNGAMPFESYPLEQQAAQFDLTLSVAEADGELHASFEYNTDLFDRSTLERMASHLHHLLAGIVDAPHSRVDDLPLLGGEERRQLLHDWNDTVRDYPRHSDIAQLFEEQAATTPDATAVVFGGERLTYAELNRRANCLAHYLKQRGVLPDAFVAISAERSFELIVGVLGILKAGAVYVPVDAEYPAERIAYMLQDAGAPVLLTQAHLRDKLTGHDEGTEIIALDADWTRIAEESDDNPPHIATGDSLAYVIYTSGSTGQPKGTCIPHRGVVRLVQNNPYVDFAPHDVFLQMSPFSFDAATFEIWGSLLNGATLVVYPPQKLTAADLAAQFTQHQVTTAFLTTALFNQMAESHLDSMSSLRHLTTGGEAMSSGHAKRAVAALPKCRISNIYGPTESTTFASIHPLPSADEIGATVPIGRPIANTQLYILDGGMQPVPVGVPGELYIGGDGLATGYLNRPELTAERFVRNPFPDTPGTHLYKTGDLVRRLPNGTIDYLGRLDFQVKLRGFRIELGEIESALDEHPALTAVIVLAREDVPGDKRLVAYCVRGAGDEVAGGALRTYLKDRLPSYMIPSAFVILDALPLTPNGKVDRKALPMPDGVRDLEVAYVAPNTELEQQITAIWQDVLGLDRVGMHDNFFDLGGHSLSVVTVHARVQEVAARTFSVVEMFRHPTVASLIQFLNQAVPEKKDLQQVRDHAAQKREALQRQKQLRKDRRK